MDLDRSTDSLPGLASLGSYASYKKVLFINERDMYSNGKESKQARARSKTCVRHVQKRSSIKYVIMMAAAVYGLSVTMTMGFANISNCIGVATQLLLQYILTMMLFTSITASQACDNATFASLSLENIYIDSLNVVEHINLTVPSSFVPPTSYDPLSTVQICSLTINYTHPGDGDAITTWVGLPLEHASWNGRFLMNGGGGWVAGLEDGTISAVASGYSSASTNAGHNSESDFPAWGLLSNGSVNWPALEDFGSRALIEAVYLGKQAAELYYGEKPRFSYWNGCSTGGRQGHGE